MSFDLQNSDEVNEMDGFEINNFGYSGDFYGIIYSEILSPLETVSDSSFYFVIHGSSNGDSTEYVYHIQSRYASIIFSSYKVHLPQQCLYFLPLPQGQGAFLPVFFLGLNISLIVFFIIEKASCLNVAERNLYRSGCFLSMRRGSSKKYSHATAKNSALFVNA